MHFLSPGLQHEAQVTPSRAISGITLFYEKKSFLIFCFYILYSCFNVSIIVCVLIFTSAHLHLYSDVLTVVSVTAAHNDVIFSDNVSGISNLD